MSERILERIAEGDRTAVRECVDRYGPLVWSLARRFGAGTEDAEDAAQEIFIALWKSAGRFDRAVASEATFIAMIARRRLVDRMRKRERQPRTETLDAAPEVVAPESGTDPERATDASRAARALSELEPDRREVLRLSIYRGLSHGEIATKLGMPLGTVKTHVRRGLARIRDRLTGPRLPGRKVTT